MRTPTTPPPADEAAAAAAPDLLDRLHRRLRDSTLALRLVVGTRLLLAAAFVPTGLVKLLGRRFTQMSVESDIGFFFEALYRAGPYWRFLGLAQVLAGLLLLVPRTAALGAVLFFPILLNVFLITLSFDFHGTPVVTGAMLLANLLLLAWDVPRWKPLLGGRAAAAWTGRAAPLSPAERACYVGGGAAGLLVLSWTRGLVPLPVLVPSLAVAGVAVAAAIALGLRAAWSVREGRSGGRRRRAAGAAPGAAA